MRIVNSVTRLGDFLNFLTTKIQAKEAQMIVQLFGLFWTTSLYVKTK